MQIKNAFRMIMRIHKCAILSVLFLLCLAACKNSSQPVVNNANLPETTKTQTNSQTDSSTKAILGGMLYPLRLSKSQLHSLQNSGKHKVIFKFYFDDANNMYPSLAAFASMNHHAIITTIKPVILTPFDSTKGKLDLSKFPQKFLGDQDITIKQIDDYFVAIGGEPSGDYNFVFIPDVVKFSTDAINISNIIIYHISLEGLSTSTASPIDTNPSPPHNALVGN